MIYCNLIRNKEKWLATCCESTAHARSKSSASLLVSDRPKHKPKVCYAKRIKSYLVRLEENPLDFPLDKVLKIERQEAMKPDGKRVCQNAVSDISARFRVSPVMTTSIRLRIKL